MERRAVSARRAFKRGRTLLAAGMILGLLLSVSFAGTAQAATTLNVGIGVGSGTTAGNVYLPGDMTVLVGDSVKWTTESDEPHSVTFGNGPAGVPPPGWPAAGFTGTNPPPPGTAALTASYDGTGFLNSELLFKGSSATVTFTKAGSFGFICQIHPGMSGTVNVVASGTTTTQADADAKAALTRTAILGAVDSLEAATTAQVTETERSDGTSLWNIYTNSIQAPAPQPGGGTGFLELLRFVPPSLEIQAGDTVRWTATAVHTVTFPAAGQDPVHDRSVHDAAHDGDGLRRNEPVQLRVAVDRGAGYGVDLRADVPGCRDVQLRLRPAPVPGAAGFDRRGRRTGDHAATDRYRPGDGAARRRSDPMGGHGFPDAVRADGSGREDRLQTALTRAFDDRMGFGSSGRFFPAGALSRRSASPSWPGARCNRCDRCQHGGPAPRR